MTDRLQQVERELADWRRVAEQLGFQQLRDRDDLTEAQQGVEYALACISEWQDAANHWEQNYRASEQRAEELKAALKKERGLKMDALLRAEQAERLMYHYQSLLGERGLL